MELKELAPTRSTAKKAGLDMTTVAAGSVIGGGLATTLIDAISGGSDAVRITALIILGVVFVTSSYMGRRGE